MSAYAALCHAAPAALRAAMDTPAPMPARAPLIGRRALARDAAAH